MNIISPLTVIDRLMKKNELGQPFAIMDHQREVLRLAFDNSGRLPWDTILYSCIKKSGKTTVNGAQIGMLAGAIFADSPKETLDRVERGLAFATAARTWQIKE
jgi:hypothetical protein